jgi:hypothetical protein
MVTRPRHEVFRFRSTPKPFSPKVNRLGTRLQRGLFGMTGPSSFFRTFGFRAFGARFIGLTAEEACEGRRAPLGSSESDSTSRSCGLYSRAEVRAAHARCETCPPPQGD